MIVIIDSLSLSFALSAYLIQIVLASQIIHAFKSYLRKNLQIILHEITAYISRIYL